MNGGGLESNIWKLYLLKFFYGFFISIPVIVLFWQQNGLSMFEIMVLQALFAVAVVALEVPTGYFADIYGRRKTMLLAAVSATSGIVVYSIGYSFIDFLIGEVLWALGVSLMSGADSAMFYDTLVEMGEEASYKERWGRASSYYMISAAGASVLGGFIADFNLRWTLYAQVPVMAAMIPVAYSLREPDHHRDLAGREAKTLKAIVTSVFRRRKLRNLVFYGAFIYAAIQTAFWFYQPYFKISGVDVFYFGLIFAGFNIISAASSKYAYVIEERLGQALSLVLLMVLIVVSLSLMSSFVFLFSFVFIALQQLVRGFSKPVISDYINKLVDSDNRSTILSTQSLLGRLVEVFSLPLFGLFADIYSVTEALAILGLTVFAAGSVILALLYTEDVLQV